MLGNEDNRLNIRRETKPNMEKKNKLKNKNNQTTYNLCRSSPKLGQILIECSNNKLSRLEFPFIEEPNEFINTRQNVYTLNTNNYIAVCENEKLPYLNLFVVGGICYNEISCLQNMRLDRMLNHHILIGSTSIINAKDYIEKINKLPDLEENLPVIELKKS